MKAVILAAGRGKRMLPLTKNVCKPMLYLHNKPILEYILDSLPKKVNEVCIVVGYKNLQIKKYFGQNFKHLKIKYVVQNKPGGTWLALGLTKKFLKNEKSFLILNADDLHSKSSINKLLKFKNAILVSRHPEPEKFGVVQFDKNNNLLEIQEKPNIPKSNLVSVGVYVLSSNIFKCKTPEALNGELFLPKVLGEHLKVENIRVVETNFWLPIGNPAEYILAHEMV